MRPSFAAVALALAGCGEPATGSPDAAGPDLAPPPLICRTPPPSPPTDRPWFTEVTAEMGLQPTASFTPLATSVRGADLDGDGWPDLIATVATTVGRDTPGSRSRFLLMNRPDPTDPTGRRRVFVDTTASSGLLSTRDGAGGRSFGPANLGDLDNDGDLDVVVCSASDMSPDPPGALLNDGHGHFTLAPASELETAADAFECASAALFDYDRDGLLDYWPATFGVAPLLFRGTGGGSFKYVSDVAGLPVVDGNDADGTSFRQTFGVTACDVDGDGAPDVLLADYGRQWNQLWRNDGHGHFTEQAMPLGVAADDDLDYSDDQSYRCWCAAHPGGCPASVPAPLAGLCPDRGWVPGVDDQPWRLGGNNFSIACGDIDNDGDMDLMTATIRHWDVGGSSDPSELLLNDSPPGGPLMKFHRPGNMATGLYRVEKGDWNEGDMMPVFADVDLDGRKDIYLTSSDYPGDHGWLWRQKPDGTFEDVTTLSGAGQAEIHGVALIDLDGDGDLDLVAGTSTARSVAKTNALRVYRNDIGQDSNVLRLRLVGGGAGRANRSAIGARVEVTAGGRTQVQEVSGGYGHAAMQHDLVLTFGLGAACSVDELVVRWPDAAGSVDRYHDVRANYRVEIQQSAPAPTYAPLP